MKKFLGCLLTSLFIGTTVTPIISCNTNDKKTVEPIKKQAITESSLDEFFRIHNTFEYKGEFFFKDIKDQSDEDNERMKSGSIDHIIYYVIGQVFGNLFNEYFDYNSREYSFNRKSSVGFSWTGIDKKITFNFYIEIFSEKNNIKYTTRNLLLNFTETKQYDDQKWIKKYLDYLIESGNSIWEHKYENYNGSLSFAPTIDWKKETYKELFLLDDEQKTKDYISSEYTDIFSKDDKDISGVSRWFYDEKKLKVEAISYKYLSGLPEGYDNNMNPDDGVIAKVHLKFSYINNPDIISEADVEILMKFSKSDLGGE